jgi:hypothetical protein
MLKQLMLSYEPHGFQPPWLIGLDRDDPMAILFIMLRTRPQQAYLPEW